MFFVLLLRFRLGLQPLIQTLGCRVFSCGSFSWLFEFPIAHWEAIRASCCRIFPIEI
ncbi:hypothetical protein Hanom_Chr04g00348441 [Helianthus anomalus]